MTARTADPARTERVREAARSLAETRENVEVWEEKLTVARDSAEDSRRDSGQRMLADPDAATSLTAQLRDADASVELAGNALEEARRAVLFAERAYLDACADELEDQAQTATARVKTHEAKTERLLRQLEAHDGRYVHEAQLITLKVSIEGHSYASVPESTGATLRHHRDQLQRQAGTLRALAAGDVDAVQRAVSWAPYGGDDLPRCAWGGGALVPAFSYLERLTGYRLVSDHTGAYGIR